MPGIDEYTFTSKIVMDTVWAKLGLNTHFRNVREIYQMMASLEMIFNPDINNSMDFILKRNDKSQKNITFRSLMQYLQ